MKKIVYIALSADLLHEGHLNIIKVGSSYGDVIIGALTDRAIASYKRLPFLPYESRKNIFDSIKGVTKVVPQNTIDYSDNLKKYKPDFVIHGDDWRSGFLSSIRTQVINVLNEWGGKLIEVPYTKNMSSTSLRKAILEIGTTPQLRLSSLRRMIEAKPLLRFLDIHNALSGLIVEKTSVEINGITREFDGMWGSSLTDSTAKGKPDIEAVDITSRLTSLNEILEVTTKPIIFDADTGGHEEHFKFTVKKLESLGVSAAIIEDKTGLKKNSLLGNEVNQTQATIEDFCNKISSAKKSQVTNDFMVIARIESLILEAGMNDAILRAKSYIAAGADGILIHSRKKTPCEVFEFCDNYKKFSYKVPLFVVPTSYNETYEKQLESKGVSVVIYANHLLRSSYPAMLKTAKSILTFQRSFECEQELLSIKDILELIPGTR